VVLDPSAACRFERGLFEMSWPELEAEIRSRGGAHEKMITGIEMVCGVS